MNQADAARVIAAIARPAVNGGANRQDAVDQVASQLVHDGNAVGNYLRSVYDDDNSRYDRILRKADRLI